MTHAGHPSVIVCANVHDISAMRFKALFVELSRGQEIAGEIIIDDCIPTTEAQILERSWKLPSRSIDKTMNLPVISKNFTDEVGDDFFVP